jgi:hypothetical protein
MSTTFEILLVGWTAVVLAVGWRLGRGRKRRLSTEEWIDAYLLGTGEGAAELVTQLLEDRPHTRVDPSHRAK